jgi:glycerol-3-phosphate acyltransferase PlsY
VLLNFFPWGVFILLIGLGLGNLFSSPAIPLLVLILLPAFAAMFGVNPFVGFWLSVCMVIITIVKRLEANRRPLPDDPQERRKVILRRIFLDRDLKDHKAWISRTPHNPPDCEK